MIRSILRLCGITLVAVALSPAAVMDFATTFEPEGGGGRTGSGSGFFQFDDVAQTLSINVNWTGLSGTTTVSHIHCCVATAGSGTVGVAVTPGTLPLFPTGVTSGSYSTVLDLTLLATYTSSPNGGFLGNFADGTASGASAALLQGILDGKAYFNIHSSTFGGGEIRGFLAPVPEPGTFLLSGLGLLGLIGWRRSRTR